MMKKQSTSIKNEGGEDGEAEKPQEKEEGNDEENEEEAWSESTIATINALTVLILA